MTRHSDAQNERDLRRRIDRLGCAGRNNHERRVIASLMHDHRIEIAAILEVDPVVHAGILAWGVDVHRELRAACAAGRITRDIGLVVGAVIGI